MKREPNAVGKTLAELSEMPKSKIAQLLAHATNILKDSGADHVIDTIRDLPDLVSQLER